MNTNILKCLITYVAGVTIFMSCKKLVEVDPPFNRPTEKSVYLEDATAISVLTGIYSSLSAAGLGNNGLLSISKKTGLSSDEFLQISDASSNDVAYFTNALSAHPVGGTPSAGHEIWNICYNYIFTCNAAIEGLSSSSSLTPNVKDQLIGEAHFMRAFFYFYLVNLYGDVPLAVTSDYEVNRRLARTAKSKVYESIVSDLKEAKNLLSKSFLNGQMKEYSGDIERVRPSYWAATAMLARTYLYMEDWSNAEAEASILIDNPLFTLVDLADVFNKYSVEAIWQLQPAAINGTDFWNTEDARMYVLTADPVGPNYSHPVYLSNNLISAFDSSDERKNEWLGTYVEAGNAYLFPYKYKAATPSSDITEYHVVLRLAEQYLIRAEARAHLGSTSGAVSDLNKILNRAKLTGYGGQTTLASLLSAILHERQVELFTEWGHRWLDLKRTGNIDAIMNNVTPQKTNGLGSWQSYKQWYPLPIEDIQRDLNLTQNSGY
jgi:starch-binding outer membrane protein, SusD/RagB family